MLLLLLLAGCLTSCAAQMTSSPSSLSGADASTLTAALLSQPVQPTQVLPSAASPDNVIAVLQAAVRSDIELNESTLPSVLSLLHGLLQELQPDVNFTLSVRNITRV